MAESVEDTLMRIAAVKGVEGYVIVDNSGTILRQSKSLSAADATVYASEMTKLAQKARHVVRDLDPKNDLEIFRLRAQEHEILVAPGPAGAFTVIVIQRWSPSAGADDLATAMMMMSGGAGGPVAAGSGAAAAAAVAAASAAGAPPGTASGAR